MGYNDSYISFVPFTPEQDSQFDDEITRLVKERERERLTKQTVTVEDAIRQGLPDEAITSEPGRLSRDGPMLPSVNPDVLQRIREGMGYPATKKNILDGIRVKIDQGTLTRNDIAELAQAWSIPFSEAEEMVDRMRQKMNK